MPSAETLVEKALAAKRESKYIEFKQALDVSSKRDWCEIIKDVVALANSGGGVILFGVDGKGKPTPSDLAELMSIDPAVIGDRVRPYIQADLPVDVFEVEKDRAALIAWVVSAAEIPIIFCQPGTYPTPGGKQGTAFGRGTVYFRHGAKSEPGTTKDIAKAIDRRLEIVRQQWLTGVRKVVYAPTGSRIATLPSDIRQSVGGFNQVNRDGVALGPAWHPAGRGSG